MPSGGGDVSSNAVKGGEAYVELSLRGIRAFSDDIEKAKRAVASLSSLGLAATRDVAGRALSGAALAGRALNAGGRGFSALGGLAGGGVRSSLGLVGSAAGVAGGAGLALGGLAGAAGLVTKLGLDKIEDLARQGGVAKALGLTVEAFTGIAGVAKSVGEDTREFVESLVTMGKVIDEGFSGKGEVATQFFEDINRGAFEFIGMRADEQFFEMFRAIREIQDPLTQVRSLMVAFGEDGGKYLLPLLAKTPTELRNMAAGFQVSTAEVERAQVAQLSFARASQSLDRVWRGAVSGLAPVVERVADAFTRAAGPVSQFVADNKEMVVAGVGIAGALGAAGLAVAAFAPAVGGLATAMAAFGPGGLISAGVAAVTVDLLRGTEAGQQMGAALSDTAKGIGAAFRDSFAGIQGDFTGTWDGISAALKTGDIAQAAEIAFAAIEVAWARTVKAMKLAWEEFKFGLSETGQAAAKGAQSGFEWTTAGFKYLATGSMLAIPEFMGGIAQKDIPKYQEAMAKKFGLDAETKNAAAAEQYRIEADRRTAAHRVRMRELEEEESQAVKTAQARLAGAKLGPTVNSGVAALGGGMLFGIGTPSANAQALGEGAGRFFPRSGPGAPTPAQSAALLAGLGAVGPLGFSASPLSAAAGLAGSPDLMRRVAAAAAATAATTTIGSASGIFGGGGGRASQIFGGGSPVVRAVEKVYKSSEDSRRKLIDIYDRLGDMGGAAFT